MNNIDKSMINQKVFDLYDDYAHNRIDRRSFMEKLSDYAVGGLTIASLLNCVMPNYLEIQIEKDDPRLISDYITYNSEKGGGEIKGLLSYPVKEKKKLPGIIVVHENRGLNPHIEDVGRRAALPGFISLAPDALTPLGGYPGNDDDGRALQKQRSKDEMLEDFIAAFDYLKQHSKCSGKVGVVGFCFGGWISNMMAVRVPELKAAVPFYGGQPDAELVPQIQAPLLLQFGELDKRVNKGWPDYEAALKNNDKEYEAFIYPNANHGFHNDTTGRYDKEMAQLAWKRTIAFFEKHLS
ncbi:MAG: dienelactone hydrolase family protein [Saprospiraceae bacterium]|nr:dienelactone hydrolase family protein [Saprospiraceae bacterium]